MSLSTVIVEDERKEQMRLQALEDLGLLDTPESESFDRITRMATQLLDAPMSAVSLTDRNRQWFKSHLNTGGRELPREGAPCAEVTRSQHVLLIPNLLEDKRFMNSPLAQSGVRFYAGAPLTTRHGHTLGSMCVLDSKPRTMSAEQLNSLQDLAAMVISQIELQHEFGRIDPTSGLPNRHQFYDDLEDQRRTSTGDSRALVLIELADLRHANEVASVLGASYLDDLVKTSAVVIKAALGRQTTLYHVGFASLAVLLDDLDSWQAPLDTIMASLKEPAASAGIPIAIAAACGISPFRLGEMSPQDVLRTAVGAVHDARRAELECAVYSAESAAAHVRRFNLLTHVRESLEECADFHLVYQPRLDFHTGECSSAEALLRWSHPKLGNVSPGEFIPLVEQTTLARPMTQWVLATALRQIKLWQKNGLPLRLSINVSARNLEEADFAESIANALSRSGVRPTDIELEFTESALIRHQARVLGQLVKIREMGIDLAIDDFGTGYSSFAYLRQLPATCVKLDQSFMRSLASSTKDRTLVQAMISMAHDIGYRVVAEGVETADVLEFLRASKCDEAQGYLIARPLEVPALEQFLEQSDARRLAGARKQSFRKAG